METLIGTPIERILADKGIAAQCAAHAQVQGVHLRAETGMTPRSNASCAGVPRRAGHRPSQIRAPNGPQLLWHREGDAANAILAAVGYNFRRLIAEPAWREITPERNHRYAHWRWPRSSPANRAGSQTGQGSDAEVIRARAGKRPQLERKSFSAAGASTDRKKALLRFWKGVRRYLSGASGP